jgi:hypothetical protein
MSWEPILAPERAAAALDAIAEAMRDPPPPYDGRIDDPGTRASLLACEPGYAMFYAYLSRARPGRGYEELACNFIDVALEHAPLIATSRPFFAFGLAGCAWAVEHLRGWLLDDADDPLVDVDEALTALIGSVPQPFGLRNGLTGYTVYALERRTAGAAACLAAIGAAFERDVGNDVVGAGVLDGKAGPTVALAAVGHRLGRELGADVRFDDLDSLEDPGEPRLAWCSGELGVAVALHAAGRATGRRHWCARALSVARAAARRDRDAMIRDAALCHGAAGVGHQFNRLYQATGDAALRDAAVRWFETALAMFDPARGLGGFLFHFPEKDAELIPELPHGWVSSPGMWKGAAGVGLALLAATTAIEPAWDRCMLFSLRDD